MDSLDDLSPSISFDCRETEGVFLSLSLTFKDLDFMIALRVMFIPFLVVNDVEYEERILFCVLYFGSKNNTN